MAEREEVPLVGISDYDRFWRIIGGEAWEQWVERTHPKIAQNEETVAGYTPPRVVESGQ